jgi:hypothetical protein
MDRIPGLIDGKHTEINPPLEPLLRAIVRLALLRDVITMLESGRIRVYG